MYTVKYVLVLFPVLVLSGVVYSATSEKLVFSPTSSVEVKIVILDQAVELKLRNRDNVTHETIQIKTEKKLGVQVEDYNFDGLQDFSISHLDDGMGAYKIYQIYVFSAQDRKFEILRPKCGDEFINVSLSRKKRTLTNSYFSNNQMKTCAARY